MIDAIHKALEKRKPSGNNRMLMFLKNIEENIMDNGFLNLVKDLAEQVRNNECHHEYCDVIESDSCDDYYLKEEGTCDCGYILAEHVLEIVNKELKNNEDK